jgi:hypothetical protein
LKVNKATVIISLLDEIKSLKKNLELNAKKTIWREGEVTKNLPG